MIWHPRAEWQPITRPVTGPPLPFATITSVAVHYPGGHVGHDTAAILRRMHIEYLDDPRRGYSLGYNEAIDRAGDVWEIRGLTIKSAATKGRDGVTNNYTYAVLLLVDVDEPAPAPMIDSMRRRVADLRHHFARPLPLHPHSFYAQTACCGDAVRAQISAGVFEPRPAPLPPTIPTPKGEDEMTALRRYRDRRYANVWLLPSGVHLSGALDQSYAADGVPLVEDVHEQTLKSLLNLSGLDRADLVGAS